MKTLTFEPLAGTSISHACKEAVAIAVSHKAEVPFDFNGITLTATPESTPRELEKQWSDAVERLRKEYLASPECEAEVKRRTAAILNGQATVDAFMDSIERGLAQLSMDVILDELKDFVSAADDIGVTFDKAKLADAFEGAGYTNNMHVGKPPMFFNDRKIMGEYILGQVVNCLRSGMPPHPVTNSFIEKYFALTA